MQRWLSWSKAHDWKSCVRLITDREFESLPLREIRKRIFIGSLFSFAKKERNQFSFPLDYFIPLRNSTGMKIHFILSENGEERLASFRLIVSTAVEGCSYAEGAQRRSPGACPLHSLCECGVRLHGGVWLIWLASVSAHCLPISRAVSRKM